MSQGPHAWIPGRLDAFLTREQRRLPPEELGRFRVLVGTKLILLFVSLMNVVTGPLFSSAKWPVVFGLVMSVGWVSLLVFMRGRTSPRLPALLACGLFTASFSVLTYVVTTPGVTSPHESAPSAIALVPVLAVYLVGIRTGLLFTLVFCVNVGLLHPLYLSGFGTHHPIFLELHSWMNGVLDIIVLLLTWALSALFRSARDAANAAVRDRERKLASLLESTDDIVCSLDAQGRIVTINSAARRRFRDVYGREPRPGDSLAECASPELRDNWQKTLALVRQGQPFRREVAYPLANNEILDMDMSLNPILDEHGQGVGVTLFGRDIRERKRAEARLDELHRGLVEASRRAGMAEMATGVLHNVGNALNSVNVSASLVSEQLRGSRLRMLSRAVELMKEHTNDLPAFLSDDARGRQLPEYLASITQHLSQEHTTMHEEMQRLIRNMEHIKAVVTLQQEHARSRGQVEPISVVELIDDALRLHATSFERLGIRIQREYDELPQVLVDRHKLLQILVNLLTNARHALLESGRDAKLLALRVRKGDDERLRIEVSDNGVGITPEHMRRMFEHGFTTKKDGHGFGLHASALAAQEMDGRLSCDSAGQGEGATFTIELPLRSREMTG
ncbi:hypothetical protein CYFUS_002016 [Cystobacter fuscus]|uniref:histidine kinase n=1 Tax=Cystobacter fuscus TaxID=43 RepID=A0A250IZM1_9BACT|nr:ATP-binding protein [Cystobacter fuscus]ATB36601.1 hypothetical protein CYFUS_002016 [Cystobacter fuscus]